MRKTEYADTETGQTVLIAREQRPHHLFPADTEGKRFTLTGAVGLELLEHSDYDGTTFRILMRLIRLTDSSCVIQESQADLARHFKVDRSTISRAFRRLANDGHIYRNGGAWFLNPQTAYTGRSEQHAEAVARMPEELRHRTPTR